MNGLMMKRYVALVLFSSEVFHNKTRIIMNALSITLYVPVLAYCDLNSMITNQLLVLACSTLFSVVLPAVALPQYGSPEHRLVLPRWGAGPPSLSSGATFHAEK